MRLEGGVDPVTEQEAEAQGLEVGPPMSSRATGGLARVMSWRRAFAVGSGVFGYFALLTVWLPSRVLQLGTVES